MYNHDIDTFIIVAETGSFSAASRKLYISKPAVTQQINLLESKLNCKLFNRNSHGVVLTEAGKLFLIQANKFKQISLETDQIMQAYQNTITVGTGYLSTTDLLEQYWASFSKSKNIKLNFQELINYEQIPSNIDLIEGIYSQEPIPKQGFLFKKVSTTPLMVAVPPENLLAKKDKLVVSDLSNQNVLIIKNNVLKQSEKIKQYLQKKCKKIHLTSYSVYNKAKINFALLDNNLFLIHKSLASSCAPFVVKNINWDFDADIGFFYRSNANRLTQKFVDQI